MTTPLLQPPAFWIARLCERERALGHLSVSKRLADYVERVHASTDSIDVLDCVRRAVELSGYTVRGLPLKITAGKVEAAYDAAAETARMLRELAALLAAEAA